jgi:transcriptional regulator with XRE-family HTH domain
MKTRANDGLSYVAKKEARLMGQNIVLARKRRGLSRKAMAEKMMVSAPTLKALECGETSVGLGVLLQALSVLGLEKGFSDLLSSSNDKVGLGMESRRLMGESTIKKEDLNF